MRKLQAPSSRIRRRSKLQIPTGSLRRCRGLGLGTWSFSGSWSLVFGSSMMLGAWCLLLLAGCAIGPNYKRPAIDMPRNFRNASETVSAESIATRRWWDVYQDETLKILIATGLEHNFELRNSF